MKKNFSILLLGAILLTSCQPNNQEIIKKWLSATNHFDKQKVNRLLTNNFVYTSPNGGMWNKQNYINGLDSLGNFDTKQSIVSIQDLDTIVKTEEKTGNVVDSVLDVTPKKIQYKTYKVKDGKIYSISLDSVANVDEYNKSLNEKIEPFAFWLDDTHNISDKPDIIKNIKKYLSEYSHLSISDKTRYEAYASLQGIYISKDNRFYRKLVFQGKTTVTIIDAIFGFPFTTSYILDGNLIRIRTDKSDLLLRIKDKNTLIGKGFASGTFKRKK